MAEEIEELRQSLDGLYTIDRLLGSGGMARVYLATDVKHQRPVAIKVLRRMVAAAIGAERFLKEIQLTASLQHPNILPLFDSGRATVEGEGSREFLYYVMPYVEGETLRQKLNREHQLGIDEAIKITREVSDALAYAHRQEVIHRDIKPENILMHDGRAMVADFGTALAVSSAGTQRLTETGVSLGTPDYMSPEQATAERELDARSDMYSLAAVLYEMLSGKSPHRGNNTQAIVASVVTRVPDPLDEQRVSVPPPMAAAVHKALAKVPADRFKTIQDFSKAIEPVDTTSQTTAVTTTGRSWWSDPKSIGISAVALVAVVFALMPRGEPTPEQPTRRVELPMPFSIDHRAVDLTLSKDGSALIVDVSTSGLSYRRLGDREGSLVPGTEDLSDRPFINHDGSRIGYVNGQQLVVSNPDGTARREYVFDLRARSGADFYDDGSVVVVTGDGISVFDLETEELTLVTPLLEGVELQEPSVLAEFDKILITATLGSTSAFALLVDIPTGSVDTVMTRALSAQYSDGYLFFARPSGAIQAVEFDPASGETIGPIHQIGDAAAISRMGTSAFSVGTGVIAFNRPRAGHLVMLSEDRRRRQLTASLGNYHSPRVSPDGRRLAFDWDEGGLVGRDVWVMNLVDGGIARVTSVGDGHDPAWTIDGQGITYISMSQPDVGTLFTVPADGSEGRRTASSISGVTVNPGEWVTEDLYLGGLSTNRAIVGDIVLFDTAADTVIDVLLRQFDEHSATVAPDGVTFAYSSNEAGQRQVFVRNMNDGGRTLVSTVGTGHGEEPRWSPDGRELFYVEHLRDRSVLRAATIAVGDEITVSNHRVVLDPFAYHPVGNHSNWDITPDGQFVVVQPMTTTWNIGLVFNWRP